MKLSLYISLLCFLSVSCINNNQKEKAVQRASESEVKSSEMCEKNDVKFWEFDIRKEYPAKDIYIQDIADVE